LGQIPEPAGELTAWLREGACPAPNPWGLTSDEVRDGLARLNPAAVPDVPGTPPDWRAGVTKLRSMSPQAGIDPHRWGRYQHDALRLLCEQGAELHAAGWDGLELFGLHRIAPDRRTDAMGVAWLMRERRVTAITPEAVSLTTHDGVVLRVTRLGRQARLEALLAWDLQNGGRSVGQTLCDEN
jgi:hypothetical protein